MSMREFIQELGKKQIEARGSENDYHASNYKKYVCFVLNDREYGVDIEFVQEIVEITYIRKIIYTPSFLLGVINLRGSIIAVLDLKQLFHLGTTDLKSPSARLIINKYEGKSLAFVVDGIKKIREISNNEVQQAPQTFNEIAVNFIVGMYKSPENNLLVLLNFSEIMATNEIKQLSGDNVE
ncbi:purine-binding chemotaxis protein CheW [Candidatus Dependentiae bacterium]|nr:purine-binding chemotaxis protein CheW [Candidatus Dependentiae bacterium]